MNIEQLLKSISSLIKKNEKFFTENPEIFSAVQERFEKAIDDEDEDSSNMWDKMQEGGSEYSDEEDEDYNPYDEMFDPQSDQSADDEDNQSDVQYQDIEDEGSSDEDLQRLISQHEHPEVAGLKTAMNLVSDPKTKAALQDHINKLNEQHQKGQASPKQSQSIEQPQQTPSLPTAESKSQGRWLATDWKPKSKYAEHHNKAIEQYMNEGYSHREAERLAGAHDRFPSFDHAIRSGIKPSEPSPKMLEIMRDIAKDHLGRAEHVVGLRANPAHNPDLHLTSHRHELMGNIHDKYHKDHAAFQDSIKNESDPRKKAMAIRDWKKQWHAENPDYLNNLTQAADKIKNIAQQNIQARSDKRDEAAMDLLSSHLSAPTGSMGSMGQYSVEAAGADEQGNINREMASQMAGGSKAGEDEMTFAPEVKDPNVGFAQQNPDYMKKLKAQKLDELRTKVETHMKNNPEMHQRYGAIKAISPKGNK